MRPQQFLCGAVLELQQLQLVVCMLRQGWRFLFFIGVAHAQGPWGMTRGARLFVPTEGQNLFSLSWIIFPAIPE